MSLRDRLRAHKDDIRLFFELLDALFFIILPSVVVVGGYFTGDTKAAAAIIGATVSLISTFRLWVKKSPLAKQLGVEGTSGDLPVIREDQR